MHDIFNTLPHPVFILETDGKITDLNQAARALAWQDGQPPADLVSLLGELTPFPYLIEALDTAFREVCAAPCPKPSRRILLAAPPSPRLGMSRDMYATVWSIVGGRVGIELLELEAPAIETNAARLAGLGSWRWFPQTNDVSWTPQLFEILGIDHKTNPASFASFIQLLHPEDTERVSLYLKAVALGQRPMDGLTYRIIRPDGQLRHIRADADTVLSRDGIIEEIYGTVLDMTAAVDAENDLRLQKEQLELAMASSGLNFWDWNLSTGCVVTSEGLPQLLGFAPGEAPEDIEHWLHRIHPDDRAQVDKANADYLTGESAVHQINFRIRKVSGDWVWVHASGKVVERSADGQPLRFLGTLRDVTRERWLEAETEKVISKFSEIIEQFGTRRDFSLSEKPTVPAPYLTERQKQLLGLVYAGKSSNEIAAVLQIAPSTVISHRRALLRKFDAHSSTELIKAAFSFGLLK